MNNYNKFNNQQKLRRKHPRRNDFISRVRTFSNLGWRCNIASHEYPRIRHGRHGINRLIRKRENMKIEVKQLGIPKFVRVNIVRAK